MSFNGSLVMVKGSYLNKVDQIFPLFGYSGIASSEEFSSWNEALEKGDPYKCPRGLSPKIVLFFESWTVIVDLEATMWTNASACQKLSETFEQPVFAMSCSGVVGSYAFSYYTPAETRSVWYDIETGFIANTGGRLPEEKGLSTTKKITESDVLLVMKRLGVDYSNIAAVGKYRILLLSFPAQAIAKAVTAPLNKPWWKFW